jgi:uncharacterized repeat protein (TIGR03803 family)
MANTAPGRIWRTGLALVFLLASPLVLAQAQKFKVLYSFTGQPDGWVPSTRLLQRSGNFYGTTVQGGAVPCTFLGQSLGCGTVFKVDAAGKETVVYSFSGQPDDGETPTGGLITDPSGNFYGTTQFGGTGFCSDDGLDAGCGTVFKIDTGGKETVVYSFSGQPDGANPYGGLLTEDGSLYGTTLSGGAYGYGTVFEIDSTGRETVLYSFDARTNDGRIPYAGLVRDKSGNLYGTTAVGGRYSFGTVFKINASGNETILHSFKGSPDGESPGVGALLLGADGNLYGTTQDGGIAGCASPNGCGIVFKLTKTGKETVLYRFKGSPNDGRAPEGRLIVNANGNLYGTTFAGGNSLTGICEPNGCGTVFKLTKDAKETVLHKFSGGDDGGYPIAGLVRDGKGNLYGTASNGGSNACQGGCGVVFKISP